MTEVNNDFIIEKVHRGFHTAEIFCLPPIAIGSEWSLQGSKRQDCDHHFLGEHMAPTVTRTLLTKIGIMLFLLASGGFAQEKGHPIGDWVTVSGRKLWYESEGKGDPIVLVAGGGGGSHGYFHPFFSHLANEYQIIYFDAFGRGRSQRTRSSSEYSFQQDVDDIEVLRKELGLGKITILGHS